MIENKSAIFSWKKKKKWTEIMIIFIKLVWFLVGATIPTTHAHHSNASLSHLLFFSSSCCRLWHSANQALLSYNKWYTEKINEKPFCSFLRHLPERELCIFPWNWTYGKNFDNCQAHRGLSLSISRIFFFEPEIIWRTFVQLRKASSTHKIVYHILFLPSKREREK